MESILFKFGLDIFPNLRDEKLLRNHSEKRIGKTCGEGKTRSH